MSDTRATTRLENQLGRCVKAQWIMGVTIVLLVLAFVLLAYWPRTHLLSRLQDRIDGDRRELAANQTRVTTLPAVALEVEQLRGRLEHFDRRLPNHPELANFLRSVNEISHETQLRNVSVRQSASQRLKLFSAQPIEMRFQGSFQDVWTFLDGIETLPRLTRVRRLRIKSVDSKLGTVDVDLGLNIYFVGG